MIWVFTFANMHKEGVQRYEAQKRQKLSIKMKVNSRLIFQIFIQTKQNEVVGKHFSEFMILNI